MKRLNVPTPDLSLPDVPNVPDVSGIADTLAELAETAADAVSSAAGRVPGLDDYRASNRRRNMVLTAAAIAAVLVLVGYLKRRSTQHTASTGTESG